MQLSAALKAYAFSIGIDCVGIASAEPFAGEEAELRTRLENGTYPAFANADISLRCNPEQMLPGCKSLVVIALAYPARDKSGKAVKLAGQIAHYARLQDYHHVLRRKLEQLAEFLTKETDIAHEHRIDVDSGPCLEKAAAKRAGIGWQGKNSLLYAAGPGSWISLGVLLTNVPLTPDALCTQEPTPAPAPLCGNCDLCLQACPTGAIAAPYMVDPSRCLSYITQMPGQIPITFRKPLGRRIWGCDTCQVVCPWNKDAEGVPHQEFGMPSDLPELLGLLTISKSEFAHQYGQTALRWRGKATLQRNAAIVLGNIGDLSAVPMLADRLVRDPKPVLRGACAWALGEIGGKAADGALGAAIASEIDETVRDEIRQALSTARQKLAGTPQTTPVGPPTT